MKEKNAVDLIQKTATENPGHKLYVLNSTGKDSMVVQHLCEISGVDFSTVFNNTTLDCADTYRIVNQHKNDWIILTPKEGFYHYVKRADFIPTRFSRGCCSIFKERTTISYFNKEDKVIFIEGIRNDESLKRSNYQDIEYNPKWNNRNWFSILPIRKWTELEVWYYIIYHSLEINPKYKKGYRRVGCSIACPYYTKTTWYLDKFWYRKQYDRWQKILADDFKKFSKWTIMNCTLEEYSRCWNGGRFRDKPTEEVINEFMEYKGFENRELAEKYFNQTCYKCGKNITVKNTVAMNLKFYGRETNQFMCKKCLMKELQIDSEQWNKYIKSFKEQNCVLF